MDIAQRKRTNRKPCKSGVYVQDVTLKELLLLTHLPSHQAAKALGLGITVFKRVCRREGLIKWPYIKPCFRLEAGQRRSDQGTSSRSSSAPNLASSERTASTSDDEPLAEQHLAKPLASPALRLRPAAVQEAAGEGPSLESRLSVLLAAVQGSGDARAAGGHASAVGGLKTLPSAESAFTRVGSLTRPTGRLPTVEVAENVPRPLTLVPEGTKQAAEPLSSYRHHLATTISALAEGVRTDPQLAAQVLGTLREVVTPSSTYSVLPSNPFAITGSPLAAAATAAAAGAAAFPPEHHLPGPFGGLAQAGRSTSAPASQHHLQRWNSAQAPAWSGQQQQQQQYDDAHVRTHSLQPSYLSSPTVRLTAMVSSGMSRGGGPLLNPVNTPRIRPAQVSLGPAGSVSNPLLAQALASMGAGQPGPAAAPTAGHSSAVEAGWGSPRWFPGRPNSDPNPGAGGGYAAAPAEPPARSTLELLHRREDLMHLADLLSQQRYWVAAQQQLRGMASGSYSNW